MVKHIYLAVVVSSMQKRRYTTEELAVAEAHWALIMRSPLPRTDAEEAEENAALARLSGILGV